MQQDRGQHGHNTGKGTGSNHKGLGSLAGNWTFILCGSRPFRREAKPTGLILGWATWGVTSQDDIKGQL